MSSEPGRKRKILVTTGGGTGRKLIRKLERAGFQTVLIPCIRIEPAPNPEDLVDAVRNLQSYDWLVLTSRNGVRALNQVVRNEGILPSESDISVAAVGPTTAAELASMGYKADLVPPKATSASLLKALLDCELEGRSLLLVQGTLSSPELAANLVTVGAIVRVVLGYSTVEEVADPTRLRDLLDGGHLDAVTLMSGSAARALHRALGEEVFSNQQLICIGPATAAVVEGLGARPTRVASPHTTDGLVQALTAELSSHENKEQEVEVHDR